MDTNQFNNQPLGGYECINPATGNAQWTDNQGEADFWAMLGYVIVDHFAYLRIGHSH